MYDVKITKLEKAEKLIFMPISEDWQKRRAAAAALVFCARAKPQSNSVMVNVFFCNNLML